MRALRTFFFVVLLFSFFYSRASASASYVLPYPSAMPGSRLYALHLVWEHMERFWHFGNYASFSYTRELSDKYLVEAKTLFEYKQYALAVRALEKSDHYFVETKQTLEKVDVKQNGRKEKQALLSSQTEKHEETLEELRKITPEYFLWNEEKTNSTLLEIHKKIESSLLVRKSK